MKAFGPRTVCGLLLGMTMLGTAGLAPAQTSAAAQLSPAPPVASEAGSAPALPEAGARPTAVPTDNSAQPGPSTGRGPHDLSPWSMFLAADVPVKAVMISLGIASLATWTILFAKLAQLSRAGRRLRRALAQLGEARTLAEARLTLQTGNTVLTNLLMAAMQEVKISGNGAADEGIRERAASRFSEIGRAEGRAVRQGLGVLASIGAVSPFVGLFGTVWGIMNSFIGISRAQTTNLAVVAPGIAEALLATAIGLVAAIPAVLIYNYFSRATKGYLELVGRGSGAVGRILSRDLDRIRGRLAAHAAE